MSRLEPNSKVIPLPFPRPFKEGAGWARTWRLMQCAPVDDERIRRARLCLAGAGFNISIERALDRELDVTIHYAADENAYSDENFVMRPREMLRLAEAALGRIALIQGVARTLWPPFRPQFSLLVDAAFAPAALILDRFVRNLFATDGWDDARIVLPGGDEVRHLGAVDFANVHEFALRRASTSPKNNLQVALIGDDLVLLVDEDSPSFRADCERLEELVQDQFVEMALAS